MMVLAIASSRRCLRCSSVALIFAISYTCLRLTVPTVSWPGLPVPFSIPAAFLRKYDTAGVFVTKVKDRSGWMVITVGIGIPGEMCAVRALNSLQKSIDLTPRAPRAGPTGGVGAALPAAMRRRCSQRCAEIECGIGEKIHARQTVALLLLRPYPRMKRKRSVTVASPRLVGG